MIHRSTIRVVRLFALTSLLAAVAFAQASRKQYATTRPGTSRPPARLEMSSDPHFHRVFANSEVRVFRLTLAPGQSTGLDLHDHDYLVVSLGANHLEAAGAANRFDLQMNDAETQVLTAGWAHKLVNISTQPANLLVVEVMRGIRPERALCGLNARTCTQVRFGKSREGEYTQTMLFETERIRLLRAELGPGGSLPGHTDDVDHLVLPVTAALLDLGTDDPAPHQAGTALWLSGGLGLVRNAGDTQARLFLIEIK
jgi:hypothetical protein